MRSPVRPRPARRTSTIPLAGVGADVTVRSVPGPVGPASPIQVVRVPSGDNSPTRSGAEPDCTGTETEVTDSTVPKYWVRGRPDTTVTVLAGAGAYW